MDNNNINISQIKEKMAVVLKDTPVVRATLFGSYAKNLATEKSDMDLLVDSQGQLRGFALFDVAQKLEKTFALPFDIFEAYELVPGGPIDMNIKQTGVLVYEKNLRTNSREDA